MANKSLEKAKRDLKADRKKKASVKKSPDQLQAILATLGHQASQLQEKKDTPK